MVMHKKQAQNSRFKIPSPRYIESKKSLVGQAGLQALLYVLDSTDLGLEFRKCFPPNGSNRSFGNYELGILLLASLLCGHDSLDDIEEFDDDELLESLFGKRVPTAKTMGNLLRRFEEEHIAKLKGFLTIMGYTLRSHLSKVHPHKLENIPYFKIDGTVHEQKGRQMEGAGWIKMSRGDFKFGYASQTVFDEVGFCYAGELCEAAHPTGHPSQLLGQVLSPLRGQKIENPFEKVAHVSGDSFYLSEEVIRCLQSHHTTFTIAAKDTINWKNDLETREWTAWDYAGEKPAKKKRKKFPECFVSRWLWSPGWSKGNLKFPVIIKKEWRADEVFGQECGSYHYHTVATNLDLSQVSYQSVIERYKPRADVENMIKEFKLGFDAKHLPCQKQSANEVYLLFVLIAQNLIRWAALLENPDKPHFSKKIRRKLINAPGQLLTGGRQLTLRVMKKFRKEVCGFLERWRSHSVTIPLYFSTA